MLERLLSRSRTLSRWLVWIGGTLILLSAVLVGLEVFLRKFFNFSFGGADELSGYAFGIATALSLAFAMFERAHIRVDAAYSMFPRWLKTAANFFGLMLLVGFAPVVASQSWSMVGDTLTHWSKSITPMRTPLAFPQIPWLAGWLYFIFCGALIALVAVRRLLSARSGRPAGHSSADELIGIKSVEEQINDESV